MRFLLLSSTRKNRMIKKQKAIACTIEDVASDGSICTYTRVAHLRSRLGLLRPCNDFIRHRFAAAAAAAAVQIAGRRRHTHSTSEGLSKAAAPSRYILSPSSTHRAACQQARQTDRQSMAYPRGHKGSYTPKLPKLDFTTDAEYVANLANAHM